MLSLHVMILKYWRMTSPYNSFFFQLNYFFLSLFKYLSRRTRAGCQRFHQTCWIKSTPIFHSGLLRNTLARRELGSWGARRSGSPYSDTLLTQTIPSASAGPLRDQHFAPRPSSPEMTRCNPTKQIGSRIRVTEDRKQGAGILFVVNDKSLTLPSNGGSLLYRKIYKNSDIETFLSSWPYFTVYDALCLLGLNGFTKCQTPFLLFHDFIRFNETWCGIFCLYG